MDMKYIRQIFIIISLATLLFGCHDEHIETGAESLSEVPVRFILDAPNNYAPTRSSSESDGLESLAVIVFDESGWMVEYVNVTPVDGKIPNDFTVKLKASDKLRHLHFVGNVPLGEIPFMSEDALMSIMSVSDTVTAFWQRKDLLIDKKKNIEVSLVRNKVKVSVVIDKSIKDDEFKLLGYNIINTMNQGSVAPYMGNGNDQDNPFAPYVDRFSYQSIVKSGYRGFVPVGSKVVSGYGRDNYDKDEDDITESVLRDYYINFNNDPKYCYERSHGDGKNHTAVVLKGIYKEEKINYYKLDFVIPPKEGGYRTEYQDLLRCFHYKFKIKSIDEGYDNAEGAVSHAAGNNILGSIEIENIDNISLGKDRLMVQYTDTIITTTNELLFRYKYIPDIKNPGEVRNDLVDFELKDPVSSKAGLTIFTQEHFEEALKNANVDEVDGWRKVRLKPEQMLSDTEYTVSQNVYLISKVSSKDGMRLWRRVGFRYSKPYAICDFNINNFTGSDSSGNGEVYNENIEPVILSMQLPMNLKKALFPLDFKIEASHDIINIFDENKDPGYLQKLGFEDGENDLSYEFGKSVRDEVGNCYYFVRHVEYDEYLKRRGMIRSAFQLINDHKSDIYTYIKNRYVPDNHKNDFEEFINRKFKYELYVSNEKFAEKKENGELQKYYVVPLKIRQRENFMPEYDESSGKKKAVVKIPQYLPYVYIDGEEFAFKIISDKKVCVSVKDKDGNLLGNVDIPANNHDYHTVKYAPDISKDENGIEKPYMKLLRDAAEQAEKYKGARIEIEFDSNANIHDHIEILNPNSYPVKTHYNFRTDKMWIYHTLCADELKPSNPVLFRPVYYEYPNKEYIKGIPGLEMKINNNQIREIRYKPLGNVEFYVYYYYGYKIKEGYIEIVDKRNDDECVESNLTWYSWIWDRDELNAITWEYKSYSPNVETLMSSPYFFIHPYKFGGEIIDNDSENYEHFKEAVNDFDFMKMFESWLSSEFSID